MKGGIYVAPRKRLNPSIPRTVVVDVLGSRGNSAPLATPFYIKMTTVSEKRSQDYDVTWMLIFYIVCEAWKVLLLKTQNCCDLVPVVPLSSEDEGQTSRSMAAKQQHLSICS
jgi:hypothetical protein